MQAEVKVARQRLSVLELAQKLGNVSDACRRRGMTRTQFYEYKKRFETQGLEGLKDLPPIHKTHPQTTSPEVEAKVVELSLVVCQSQNQKPCQDKRHEEVHCAS